MCVRYGVRRRSQSRCVRAVKAACPFSVRGRVFVRAVRPCGAAGVVTVVVSVLLGVFGVVPAQASARTSSSGGSVYQPPRAVLAGPATATATATLKGTTAPGRVKASLHRPVAKRTRVAAPPLPLIRRSGGQRETSGRAAGSPTTQSSRVSAATVPAGTIVTVAGGGLASGDALSMGQVPASVAVVAGPLGGHGQDRLHLRPVAERGAGARRLLRAGEGRGRHGYRGVLG